MIYINSHFTHSILEIDYWIYLVSASAIYKFDFWGFGMLFFDLKSNKFRSGNKMTVMKIGYNKMGFLKNP